MQNKGQKFALLKSEGDIYTLQKETTKPVAISDLEAKINAVAKHLKCKSITTLPIPQGEAPEDLNKMFPKGLIYYEAKKEPPFPTPYGYGADDPGHRVLIIVPFAENPDELYAFEPLFHSCDLFAVEVSGRMKPIKHKELSLVKKVTNTKRGKLVEIPPPLPILDGQDKIAFLAAISQGIGVTRSAELILMHPKDISILLRSDDALRVQVEEGLKFAAKTLVVIGNSHLQNRQFDRWHSNTALLRDFRSDIVLWGDYGKVLAEATNKDILLAYHVYKDIAETATSLGCLKNELLMRVFADDELTIYFEEKNIR